MPVSSGHQSGAVNTRLAPSHKRTSRGSGVVTVLYQSHAPKLTAEPVVTSGDGFFSYALYHANKCSLSVRHSW
jgi:hypothetical protein